MWEGKSPRIHLVHPKSRIGPLALLKEAMKPLSPNCLFGNTDFRGCKLTINDF